jgi:predicted permease
VLTGAGALFGLVLAVMGLDALLRLAPGDIPRVDSIGIDARVLVATLVISVVVGLAFGALPILQAFRTSLQPTLAGASGRGASGGVAQGRFRSAMVVTELALAVMLLVGAGLMVRSLWRLQEVDAGFRAQGVLKAEYQLPGRRYPRNNQTWPRWTETTQFNINVAQRVMQLPGVVSATVSGLQPMAAGFTSSVQVVGREAEAAGWPEPAVRPVGAGYFSTMGVEVAAGRMFSESDDVEAPPVAIINRAAAERFFGNRDPLGQRLRMWGAERTIVGVVANERFRGLDQATPPAVYYPLPQVPSFAASYSLLVRTSGDPAAVMPSVRAAVRAMDPELPLFAVEPLTQTVADSLGQRRFTMLVLGVFAALALILAVIGVHGVLSYTVAQRQREIGIRMALGADLPTVRGMVMSQGTLLAGLGLGTGLVGAFALTRLLTAMLYGVTATDPITYGGVVVLLGIAALVATYLPARRATLVDPVTALRTE